jgi:hypothetical protein
MTHRRSDARSDGVELELAALRGRVAMVEAELVALRAARDQLATEVERLSSENRRLQSRVGELAAQVEELRRASRRQAARSPRAPRRPTRDGRAARRARPTATTHAARSRPSRPGRGRWAAGGLPALWRDAHCRPRGLSVPRRPPLAARERDLPLRHPDRPLPAVPATCQPPHPEQTSQALARPAFRSARARSRWRCGRPRAGLPAGKVARLLGQLGITITPGGVTQALARAARRLQPTYAALVCGVQPARSLPQTRPAGAWMAGAPGCGLRRGRRDPLPRPSRPRLR